jgi:hypothetical protein
VVVLHSIELPGNTVFDHPELTVAASGEIHMGFPATVTFDGGTVIVDGHMLLIGEIILSGAAITIGGYFEAIGQFTNGGGIGMDAGVLQVEGDLTNLGAIDGTGSICVYDTIDNAGTIAGTVDICDATPTTSTAPIVDCNTGTIAGTVTYCSNSVCGFAGVRDAWSHNVGVYPDPSSGPVTIRGLAGIRGGLTLRDATGRTMAQWRLDGLTGRLDIDAPCTGLFTVEVTTAAGSKVWKLIFAEGASR